MFTTTVTPVPASQPGALAGYEVRCTCGDVQSSSLVTGAYAMADAHERYHARKAGKR